MSLIQPTSRRDFITRAGAFTLGIGGLRRWLAAAHSDRAIDYRGGYGEIVPDPHRVFSLPAGFSYRVISRAGDEMDDGLLVPARCDGMASFRRTDGDTALICNHEVSYEHGLVGAFGRKNERLDRLPKGALYDGGLSRTPSLGGTTTTVLDGNTGEVKKRFLSLAGTVLNCAGGPTPWGSWVSCEETVDRAGRSAVGSFEVTFEKDHGYPFEVPASANGVIIDPVPLKSMGRFRHEAVSVDPRTGIVYQTEDRPDGLIYRYLPATRGDLAGGGRLQALAIVGRPSLDTRNWLERTVAVGQSLKVTWIDVDGVDSPDDDLRYRAFDRGAARFARGEGMWFGNERAYWACTNGGAKQAGQIWQYRPIATDDAAVGSAAVSGELELFIEPDDTAVVENADNVSVAPWGDLFVCEDGAEAPQYLLGVTPAGQVYKFGRNELNSGELAGVNFSPDGSTLFVNLQTAGWTLAVMGPWQSRH